MRKQSYQLLKEYPRTNKRLPELFNKFTSQNPNLQRQLGLVRERERERGEKLGTRSLVSDWCVILASLLGFPPLRWPPYPSGLTNKARPTAPTWPRRPQINFISTNHNSQHFIPGMGCATRKLPNDVILSHHRTNIKLSQEKYDITNHPKHHKWHTFPLCHTIYHLIIRSV